jgi:hypothetical protein
MTPTISDMEPIRFKLDDRQVRDIARIFGVPVRLLVGTSSPRIRRMHRLYRAKVRR